MKPSSPRIHRLRTPLAAETLREVRVGDRVLLTGTVYGARDAAHRRMIEALDRGETLPVPLQGMVLYYVGPTPARPGEAIGSAGPTTAARMDPFTPRLLEMGLRATIGKGQRSLEVREAQRRHGAVYFVAVGGAAALLATRIRSHSVLAWEDLGTEAFRCLEVEDFPLVLANDLSGRDLFEEVRTASQPETEAPS